MRRSPVRLDVAAAVAAAAGDLLADHVDGNEVIRALERLRARLRAASARVWVVTDDGAQLVLEAAAESTTNPGLALDREAATVAIDRLKRNSTIVCRRGDVSGVEALVPAGTQSYVVTAGTTLATSNCLLVLGWSTAAPPCDEAGAAHLRVATSLFGSALASPDRRQLTVADAALGSLRDHVAVIDRKGKILAVNAAWTEFGHRRGITSPDAIAPGVNYLDVCIRAAAAGSDDAAVALEGILAVCSGETDAFETAYLCSTDGQDRWWTLTATRLRHADGGVVIVHSEVTPRKIRDLAQPIGESLFHRLANTLPVPIWIMTTEGRPTYANQHWIEAIDRTAEVALSRTKWTDPLHPDDRAAATAALEAAVSQRSDFNVELRFKRIDGTFRWAACLGAPHYAPDGGIVGYVGICCDVSAKHHAESTLNEVAGKLVAAQESERGRIARELHDDLGQQVALLASRLEALLREQKLPRSRVHAALLDARTNLQEIAVTIHSLSHELHPAKLKLLGLALTLETLCRDVAADSRVTVRFHDHQIPSDLDETVALCIFRVAQEALQNAIKHSGARVIDVYVSSDDGRVTLQVSDNGVGFDPLLDHSTGLGLLTMRERAELIGGRLAVSTTPPHGTTVTVTVPMTRGAGRLA